MLNLKIYFKSVKSYTTFPLTVKRSFELKKDIVNRCGGVISNSSWLKNIWLKKKVPTEFVKFFESA